MLSLLLVFATCVAFSFGAKEAEEAEETAPFDYMDRVCGGIRDFVDAGIVQAYDGCVLSADKTQCQNANADDNANENEAGTDNTCKFIGNSNTRMCVNPEKHLEHLGYDESLAYITNCSVSLGTNQICYWDDNSQLYDFACRKLGGVCDQYSRKCALPPAVRRKYDLRFETHKSASKTLPSDYTNNLLIVVDGTSTRKTFESGKKQGQNPNTPDTNHYKMSRQAYNENGNWVTHNCNFYEDYRGAAYYWYGPINTGKIWSAGEEVKHIANGAHAVICEFMKSATANGKYTAEDINIDVIGYSRGGYAAMEIVRKTGMQKCEGADAAQPPKKFRFVGLYDPVSSCMVVDRDGIEITSGIYGDYNKQEMPADYVDHIAIAYGNSALGSRPWFNTCEVKADQKKTNVDAAYFTTTHSGVGGDPTQGDYDSVLKLQTDPNFKQRLLLHTTWVTGIEQVQGYGPEKETSESIRADMWMREQAVNAGVPVFKTDTNYYNFDKVKAGFQPQQQQQSNNKPEL